MTEDTCHRVCRSRSSERTGRLLADCPCTLNAVKRNRDLWHPFLPRAASVRQRLIRRAGPQNVALLGCLNAMCSALQPQLILRLCFALITQKGSETHLPAVQSCLSYYTDERPFQSFAFPVDFKAARSAAWWGGSKSVLDHMHAGKLSRPSSKIHI